MESKQSKFNKSFLWKIIAIVTFAIMFIPMMYSLFYLGAFWDPYGSLKDVPVAFVNLDEPYMKDGKDYTYGKDLEKKLKDNDSFKWEFISYNKAKKGVDGASYYAMIVVPKDFSKKLANSTSGDFQKPQIIYRANKGRNFIFSQLSLKGAESIQNQISSNISKETSKVLVDKLYEVKASLKDASDAQNKIQDGTQKLVNGGQQISANLGTAYTGSQNLQTGLLKLLNGSNEITSNLLTASNGSSQLNLGLKALSDGQDRVVGGVQTLKNGLTTFKSSLSSGSSNMSQLVSGADSLNKSMGQFSGYLDANAQPFKDSMDNASNAINGVADHVSTADELLNDAMTDLEAGNIDKAKDEINYAKTITSTIKKSDLKTNVADKLKANDNVVASAAATADNLKTAGTSQVAYGVHTAASTLNQTLTTANQGIDQMLNGVDQLKDGSTKVDNGLHSAYSSTGILSSGLSQLYTGSTTLQSGLSTAASSTGTLASGLGQLSDGSKTLATSLVTLNDGTTKLKTGLNDGYSKLNDNLKFTSNDMSKFVSDPVKLSDQSINDVKKYGEGLAPYFISLSLWLGAMFVNIILTLVDKFKLTENKFLNSFIGKFIAGVALVSVQAIILALSLNAGLGLDAVNTTYLYLNNIFTSLVFFSVMYGLSAAFGIMSTPISFVLLILQLSSCAGTFPIETAPLFYRVVSKFIPMTYTVKVVRMILSGIDHSGLMQNISILLTFMFTFLIGGFLIQTLRTKLSEKFASKKTAEEAA